MLATACSAGIDVAKRHLDLCVLPGGLSLRVPNDDAGRAALVGQLLARADADRPGRVVVEATGGYERRLADHLLAAGLPVALVNPLDARRFARASRVMAKNDRLDARVLAEFGRRVETRPLAAGPGACGKMRQMHALRQLVARRRRQLVDQCVALRNHLEHAADVPEVAESVRRSLAHVREEVARVEALVQQRIDADPALKARQERLRPAAGVGPAVSRVLVAEPPELGALPRRKIAALVGVAPSDDDSGRHRGRRAIRGGRHTVRAALYMATLVGVRRDPHLRAHYQQLLARGKPKKLALVACMNKRLAHLNGLLRDQPASP